MSDGAALEFHKLLITISMAECQHSRVIFVLSSLN